MKSHHLVLALFALSGVASAQEREARFPIWPGVAPGSEGWTQKEAEFTERHLGEVWVRNVVKPTLTAYLPAAAKATGDAVIVVPGGGMSFTRWANAVEIAEWLASRGVAAFVLRHRLTDTGTTDEDLKRGMDEHMKMTGMLAAAAVKGDPLPALDAKVTKMIDFAAEDLRQSVRSLRKDAKSWGVRPDRIGVLGLSSGGVLTMGAALKHDADGRPDFIAPIYTPWFAEAAKGPTGSAPSFLVAKVPPDAPPAFILVASDDPFAESGSLLIYKNWKSAGRSAELHVYSRGGHGFGVKPQGLPVDGWLEQFVEWLMGLDREPR